MDINEQIYLQNPWLRDAVFLPKEFSFPQRDIFESFYQDIISLKQITSLVGLRRVGKSTLIKQVIGKILKNKISPKKILYFSFDQPTIIEEPQTLERIITFYFNRILNKQIHNIKEKVFIFFDEIQLIPYWQDIIKRYYDINQQIKFVVSGSSTLFIHEKAKESLAGRIFERRLPPLNFAEYKRLSGANDFIDFLNFGQFPELLEIKDIQKKIDYLKEGVIGKILEVDIVKAYKVRKITDFERLFWSLLPNSGQIVQSGKLMSDLGMKKATLFKYLSILEKSLLIDKVLNLSGSFRSEARLLRKLYPASSNFISLVPETINLGFKVETYVNSILKGKEKAVYLYNRRGKEIDFVLPDKRLALEVKYQEHVRPADYAFLEKFIKEKKYKGIVISKNQEKNIPEKNLSLVPLENLAEFVFSSVEV